MAEFPALPLFTDAFIADTTHLTALQTGAYLLLLMTAWRTDDCALPADERYLARVARLDARTWASNRDAIMAFWRKNDLQKWCQHRLVDEHKYVRQQRRKNADAGRASALKRKGRHSTTVATETQPETNQPTSHIPHPTDSIDKPKGLSSGSGPEGLAPEQEQEELIPLEKKPANKPKAVKPPPPDWDGRNDDDIPERTTVRMSNDFALSADLGTYAIKLGRTKETVLAEGVKFKGYFTDGKGASVRRTVKGWRQSWYNWIGKERRYG